jgi:hypothetical protein
MINLGLFSSGKKCIREEEDYEREKGRDLVGFLPIKQKCKLNNFFLKGMNI